MAIESMAVQMNFLAGWRDRFDSMRDHDYVSEGLKYARLERLFPYRKIGPRLRVQWPYFRKSIAHNWYVDMRNPSIGFLNTDESAVLHSNARLFAGGSALEIGAWRGWSALQIATAGVAHLDVIDPVLLDNAILSEFNTLFEATNTSSAVRLHPGESPVLVEELINSGQRWDFAFIDGNHDAPAPVEDVFACLPGMNDRAMIVFHDLMSPDVSDALCLLQDLGWNTKIIQTSQIMGIAWRGDVSPAEHIPDPTQDWSCPHHLARFFTGEPSYTYDLSFLRIWHKCKSYTLTSMQRAWSLYSAVRYIIANKIEGDFVECGVWRGGSVMIVLETLRLLGSSDRRVWLYDTFRGMTDPSALDVDVGGLSARQALTEGHESSEAVLCAASLEDVRCNLGLTGYPMELVCLIEGDVRETLKTTKPNRVSLLRLDTDFYDSTLAELNLLYPVLLDGGVLILDDYGHWLGARKAVDEYLANLHKAGVRVPLLTAVDYTGRVGIK